MNETGKVTVSSGFSLGTVLFLIFLVLKLTKTITWSWWWITAPLWIPWAILLSIVAVILLIGLIAAVFNN